MKSVELMERVNSSRPGDIVLDPFGGSGSTLIACERTGTGEQDLQNNRARFKVCRCNHKTLVGWYTQGSYSFWYW